MHIVHIVPAVTRESSGPSYSVTRLCEELIVGGDHVELAALDWEPGSESHPFTKTFSVGWGPRKLGRSPDMLHWLREQAITDTVSVLHSHAIWQMNTVYPGWVANETGKPLVCSPRGMLSDWSMTRGSKMKGVFWPLLQRPALRNVTCFHATADSECADIRALGFRQPIAVIPNGIDVYEDYQPGVSSPRNVRTLLFLGRLHPKKGLDLLLSAWRAVQSRFTDWQLVIAGADVDYYGESGYLAQLRAQAQELRLVRVSFVGELLGEAKRNAYRDASLFILPTYSENFGLTVAESLAAGTPVIVTKGAPWEGLKERRAGWWVDVSLDAVVASLEQALLLDDEELRSMGRNGRDWMRNEFSWRSVASKMHQTYQWLAARELPMPSWVRPT